jgi:FlgN protein
MEELARLLSREQLLLELLLYKLVSLRQLLTAGEGRFLHWAAEEVERATEKVRTAEINRSLHVAALAAERGLDADGLSLSLLAEDAPAPWNMVLSDHRRDFLRIAAETEATLSACRRLAAAGASGVADLLERLDGPRAEVHAGVGATTYGPSAQWDEPSAAARISWHL